MVERAVGLSVFSGLCCGASVSLVSRTESPPMPGSEVPEARLLEGSL